MAGIAVVALIVLSLDPNFTFNIPGFGNATGGGDTYYFNNQTQSDSRAPTSLYSVVEPNPMVMGWTLTGRVTSDGYRYPITAHAKHKGQGTEQTFGGLLDATGKFTLSQVISTPGYWQFWVTAGAVSSNRVDVTVKGIATVTDRDHVSKSLSPTCVVGVFSNYGGNCAVFANDPAHGVSIPLTNTVINSGGYGSVLVDWSSFANGSYEVDAVIAGETATMYGGTCWVTVGR